MGNLGAGGSGIGYAIDVTFFPRISTQHTAANSAVFQVRYKPHPHYLWLLWDFSQERYACFT